jgi:gamma-tubulin complex component 5
VERALRPGPHGRVDQFAVARQLDGLQEKFEVVDRPELADALRTRLSELENYPNAWHPEILSLLLQLSDRPSLLSRIENLPKREALPADDDGPLSWSNLDVNPHSAFEDENIWEEVDFAAGSSDDDFSSIASEISAPRDLSNLDGGIEAEYVIPDDVFVPADDDRDLLVSIRKGQFWRSENKALVPRGKELASQIITELQLARETIFMLQGLPTSIFWHLDEDVVMDRSYTLKHSSSQALSSLLQSFMEIGTQIDSLRRFTKSPQVIPYMQTFCRGIEERLLEFDRKLSQNQVNYLSAGCMVSLLQLLNDVRQYSCHLQLLSDLISRLKRGSEAQPMRCLDLLYDLVCMREALGDESETLSALFFSCLKTYTTSISRWMETGHLDSQDNTFFVQKHAENRDLKTIWHDWYTLDDIDRPQNIPKFLKAGIRKIFITGKSMVFLRHLNALPDISERPQNGALMLQDSQSTGSFLPHPFSSLVESAFDRLVDSHHSSSAGLLRKELDEQCGLWTSLDALQHVYLGSDLSILGTIDTKIFELMDRGRSWDDKFLLMEVTRSAFSVMPTIDPSRLIVRSAGCSTYDHQSPNRSVRILESISIDYVLPWPVANIITPDAMATYQRISTFLLQIRRSKYAIVKQRAREARRAGGDGKDNKLVHALHHNLLWFLDSLYSHLTYFVIATSNQYFHLALSNAEDVDAMIAVHQSYTASLEEQCLLSKNLSPIHEAIINLLDLSINFADLQTVHAAEEGPADPDNTINLDALRPSRVAEDDSDSDWDEDKNEFDHEQTLTISFRDSPYDQQMRNVKLQFDHLASFVADGLKGVARADGMPSWNILADRLEWQKGWLRS